MSEGLTALAMRIAVFCNVVLVLTYRGPERPASHPPK